MNCIRSTGFLVLVLGFGLAACTPDAPKKHEDQWRMSPPEVVLPEDDSGARTRLKVGEASQNQLPLEAELSFSEMSGISLEIKSLCSVGDQNFSETFHVSGVDSLQIGSIVPSQSLLQKTDELTCSLDFIATNSVGSTHRFQMPGLTLSHPNSFGSLAVTDKLESISPNENLKKLKVEDLDQIALDSKIKNGIAELSCSSFVSRQFFTNVDLVDWKALAYNQSSEVLQQVEQNVTQTCRMMITNNFGVRVESSTPFVLKYPLPELKVSVKTATYQATQNSKWNFDVNVLYVEIENPSAIDQILSVPLDSSITASQRAISRNTRTNEYCFLASQLNANISSVIADADVTVEKDRKLFVVKANSVATLTVVANGNLMGGSGGSYYFGFSSPYRIQRIQNSEVVDEISVSETDVLVTPAKEADRKILANDLRQCPASNQGN